MSDSPVNLSRTGPPETVLPPMPAECSAALAEAVSTTEAERRSAVADVVARWPRQLTPWAELGDLGRDDIERYAAFRVGYHRGLDTLRANGWRGSGYVRWAEETNRGFLRCLVGLRQSAAAIGEADEEHRCAQFLNQLDPSEFPPPSS